MASLQYSFFIPALVKFLIHSCLLLSSLAGKTQASSEGHDSHTADVDSLFPIPSVCKSSKEKDHQVWKYSTGMVHVLRSTMGRLPVPHPFVKFSPMMSPVSGPSKQKLNRCSNTSKFTDMKANIPAQSGTSLASGNFIVNISLGTPAKALSLAFDTGSDLTWTQCQPCTGSCYKQHDPIFDPSSSSSYSKIPSDAQCSGLAHATNPCGGTTCAYKLQYLDDSTSEGLFSKDTITLTQAHVFLDFLFGCGQDNQGLYGETAGILGLGRDPISLVSQTGQKYDKYFSYYLPSKPSSTGHLTLGKSPASTSNVKFTPFDSSKGTSFYFVNIVGIRVGRLQLPIDPSVFKNPGSIIDSGTVITRLPPTAYSALSTAFQEVMAKYPRGSGTPLLDTCYDMSNFTTITTPIISFTFAGNVAVDLGPVQIFSVHSVKQVCLAFAANEDDQEVAIIGNRQHSTLEVVYDVAGGNLGFGTGGCN